ncbi:hypothetical protein LSM04_000082 [Trypanosoma melophagium]|uniref:uncharacterized protein n=1 Tax=Trypanosoma melophagium TaxID=715481 RepID=UPI00351A22DC|nr:hypothetical protein LSM04_000082 [Trypanosoma melophagium]
MVPLRKRRTLCALFTCFFCLVALGLFYPAEQSPAVRPPPGTPLPWLPNNEKNGKNQTLYEYRIFVFTYARPDGLRVTLSSILNSDYSKARGSTIDLEVFVDYRRSDSESMRKKQTEIMEILNSVSWPYGRYKIHQRYTNVGLRYSIMEAWQPVNDREVAAFFEDDVEVSPYWFSWVAEALVRYAPIGAGHAIDVDDRFIGLSLFRPLTCQYSVRDITVNNGYAPFLLQQPSSWGAVYFPKQWRQFREFFDETKDKDLQVNMGRGRRSPLSNKWDYPTSWKKSLVYYMHLRGWYMMYPNFPNRLVLSTSHQLAGVHRTPSKAKFVLPLVGAKDMEDAVVRDSVWNFPSMGSMKVYDVMFNELPVVHRIPSGGN